MPAPTNERRSLQHERAELVCQLAAYRQELENSSPHKARRERLDWQIRRAQNPIALIETRLAAIRLEAP